MRRSLAAVFWSLVLGLTAVQVAALGVGDIALDSALNEPFRAEIPFESYGEGDFDGLSVSLASKDTFERYGLDLPAYLKDFDFAVADNATGEPVIRVTSRQAVSEPFVTMLLDIKWASGRLLREYTVLLDPPLFEAAAAAEPVAPAVAAPATSQAAGQVSRPAAPAPVAPVASPAPAPQTRSAAVPVVESAAQPAAPALEGTYSVQRRDTLWGIAERVRGNNSELTVNQVMLALYNANPDAFLGNINKLKAGAILRVPEGGDIAEVSPRAATAEVLAQNAALASGTAPEPGRLELVTPGTAGDSASGTAELDGGAAGSAAAAEQAELSSRIGELQSELQESQRLVQLRDAELAALQARVAELENVVEADTLPADGDVALDDAPLTLDEPLVEDAAAAGDADPVFADEVAPVDEALTEPTVDEPAAVGDDPAPAPVAQREAPPEDSFIGDLLTNMWVWVSAAVVLLLALFIARRRKGDEEDFAASDTFTGADLGPEPVADAEHQETLRDLEAVPSHADSIVVEEGGDAATMSDFAEVADPANQTSQLDDVMEFDFTDDSPPPVATGQDAAEVETPLEKTISTGAPLNLDQADPIAEAEFHMAYGLYDQAADLLERALKADPDNRAYRVKLVEVFFVWENRDGFMKHAKLLHESIADDSDSDWNKVVILGKQLCPDEGLFSGATAAPAADSMDLEFTADSGEADLDFTLGGTDVKTLDADLTDFGMDDADGEDAEADLDFDLGGDLEAELDDDDLALDLSGLDDAEAADTLETPTVEADFVDLPDSDTLETPTLESELADDAATMESPALADNDAASTLETPTLENPMDEATVESPTLESAGSDGETTEMPALSEPDFDLSDADEEIELGGADDLDVDLSGLADAGEAEADSTTLASSLEDDAGLEDEDATLLADFADVDDPTLLAGGVDVEAALEAEIEAELDLQTDAGPAESEALSSDTVQQPQIDPAEVELGDTAEQPAMSSASVVDMDLGLGTEEEADEDLATAIQESSLPEDATMTEVGTKLDLARAYIDMGDPDGARSILGEVLDEGAEEQQQEARHMLEELGD